MFTICLERYCSTEVGEYSIFSVDLEGATTTISPHPYSRSKMITGDSFARTITSWLVNPVCVMTSVTGNEGTCRLKLPASSVTVPLEVPLTETDTLARDESLSVLFTLPLISCCDRDDNATRRSRMQKKKFLIKKCLCNDRLKNLIQ